MSPEDKDTRTPGADVPAPAPNDPRSGNGADTALRAMLKKRQMRANVDEDGEAGKDDAPPSGT